jgi:hypothetical protein
MKVEEVEAMTEVEVMTGMEVVTRQVVWVLRTGNRDL